MTDASRLSSKKLYKRLLPLFIASFAQWLTLWVAVEKLFMVEIGFDAASIGLMAALYAMFVPLIEVPSGIIADRWSRKGILIIASLASILSALIGALSYSVPAYIVSALVLGIFFALTSGTLEAVIYDTVMEEKGESKSFEKQSGRLRVFNSIGGLLAALMGGALAAATTPRVTYWVTAATVGISVVALLKFKEPTLHKMEVSVSLKDHISTTYKILLQKGRLLPIVALLVLAGMLVQVLLEFGQLWLIALETPVLFYGTAFAALTAALGFGGLLAGRIKFHKTWTLFGVISGLIISSLVLVYIKDAVLVTLAQVILVTLIIVTSTLFTRLMHDAVPSKVRSGVASGVSAFSWIVFVPFSLLFGWVSNELSVFEGGWLIVALAILSCIILAKTALNNEFKKARLDEELANFTIKKNTA